MRISGARIIGKAGIGRGSAVCRAAARIRRPQIRFLSFPRRKLFLSVPACIARASIGRITSRAISRAIPKIISIIISITISITISRIHSRIGVCQIPLVVWYLVHVPTTVRVSLVVPELTVARVVPHVATDAAHHLGDVTAHAALSKHLRRHVWLGFTQSSVEHRQLAELVAFEVVLAHGRRDRLLNHLVGELDRLPDASSGIGRDKYM